MSRQDPGAQSRGPFTPLNAVIFCLEEGLVPSIPPCAFHPHQHPLPLHTTSWVWEETGPTHTWKRWNQGPFLALSRCCPNARHHPSSSVCAIQPRDGPQAQREQAAGRQGQVSHTQCSCRLKEAGDRSECFSVVPWQTEPRGLAQHQA